MNINKMNVICIVGCGPRGLSSLESLMAALAKSNTQIEIQGYIFEPQKYPGAGWVWDLDQVDSNWMNISDRALCNLKGREEIEMPNFTIPTFPSYIDWMKSNRDHILAEEKDDFPPRRVMGTYLNERFNSIFSVLETHKLFQLIKAEVKDINYQEDRLVVIDEFDNKFLCSECLLSIGHQSTFDDDQIKKWKVYANNNKLLLVDNPYNFNINDIKHEDKVAIRGFGLAMIDVVRMLTVEKGGVFKSGGTEGKLLFIPSEKSVQKIASFSLDGLPMVPKPLGYDVDRHFEVTEEQERQFEKAVRRALKAATKLSNLDFLLDPFSEIAAEKYISHPAVAFQTNVDTIKQIIKEWLLDMSYSHPLILNTQLPTYDYMQNTVSMALGHAPPSIDFCVGQVWRHLQPKMYVVFSHCDLRDELMEKVIALDESTKRYSYGPPVESIQQLIALTEAGVLDLSFTKDPDIKCADLGWELSLHGKNEKYNVMIDSVLDAPKLVDIDSGLIIKLKQNDVLTPVTTDLGVQTHKDGVVELSNAVKNVYLSILGRNAKGSVLGVDAILECFGPRIEDWASGVITRLNR